MEDANTMILAIDPGPTQSAFIVWDHEVYNRGLVCNGEFMEILRRWSADTIIAIEMVQSFGMPVGREVFETCVTIGRIVEIFHPKSVRMVYRRDIKLHLCGSARAKDSNIRQALIDRVGPQGKKHSPGPTYGLAKHDWAALAIAIYVSDHLTTAKCVEHS